jgi:protein arginine kinase activator
VSCDVCGVPEAGVHLIEVIDGAKREVHLCAGCADQRGLIIDPTALGVAAKLEEILPEAVSEILNTIKKAAISDLACPSCGRTFAEFQQDNRLGCAEEYQHFRPLLLSLLEKIQKTGRPPKHVGRVSERALARRSRQRKIETLKTELQAAINEQRFERAAELRDQLDCLQKPEGAGHETR